MCPVWCDVFGFDIFWRFYGRKSNGDIDRQPTYRQDEYKAICHLKMAESFSIQILNQLSHFFFSHRFYFLRAHVIKIKADRGFYNFLLTFFLMVKCVRTTCRVTLNPPFHVQTSLVLIFKTECFYPKFSFYHFSHQRNLR